MVKRAATGRFVLLVEDDEAVRWSTERLLTRAGHRVRAYSGGDEFLEAGIPEGAEAILLDIRMPGASGLDVLRALRGRAGMPPVVVLTGHGDLGLGAETMRLGAAAFLEKPCPVARLLETIDRITAESEAARA